MKVKEFRKLEQAIYKAADSVRSCHLEDLRDAVGDALEEVAEAYGELEDALNLEDD